MKERAEKKECGTRWASFCMFCPLNAWLEHVADMVVRKEAWIFTARASETHRNTRANRAPRKKNYNKGELAFKHAIGLGSLPNAVPVTEPVLDGPSRAVEVGWHPVGGLAGKWFAERTGLGKLITERTNKYPDPTQHWAVLVGDFAHQLWMVSFVTAR
jgi:hypothetical protein